jgi:hypothetical protein
MPGGSPGCRRYFDQMDRIAANKPVSAFDCSANGRVDFADVVRLFNNL